RLAEAVHSEGVFLGVSQCGVVRRLCVWRAGSVITSCYRNLVGQYLASVIEWRSGECAFWYKGRGVREVRAAVLWAGLVWMNMPELTCSEWWDAGLQLGCGGDKLPQARCGRSTVARVGDVSHALGKFACCKPFDREQF
ncbi:hypothetical protein EAH_00067180, partial [Eimeria acervulina]